MIVFLFKFRRFNTARWVSEGRSGKVIISGVAVGLLGIWEEAMTDKLRVTGRQARRAPGGVDGAHAREGRTAASSRSAARVYFFTFLCIAFAAACSGSLRSTAPADASGG